MSKLTVYYNSACPVCNAGIGAEKRRMEACAVDAEWIDIHQKPDALKQIGATQEFVRERLHVVDEAGVHIGAAAIGALWSKTAPRQRLAAFIRMPLIRVLAGWLYNAFAAVLYRWNRLRGRW
jgi:predicted DCC family thiol-disulfide oxidoreductase YuxK